LGNHADEARAPELASARCLLRPIRPSDLNQLHAIWSRPGVRRFLWDGIVIPVEQTGAAIARSEQMFAVHRFGLWGASLRSSSGLIGFGGLWPFRDPPEFELLYGIDEPMWGRGYATEVAQAVLAYCFDVLDMPSVRASTDAGNGVSIRVLEKLGFAFVRRSRVGGLDTVFYEMRRTRGSYAGG
jgi:RimJ/RimL family protein N-acetyltransferase